MVTQLIVGFSGVVIHLSNELIWHLKEGLVPSTQSSGRVTACHRTDVWSLLTHQRAKKGWYYNGIQQIAVFHLLGCCFSWVLLDLRSLKSLLHPMSVTIGMLLSSPCLYAWLQTWQCNLSFGSGLSQSPFQCPLIYMFFIAFLWRNKRD